MHLDREFKKHRSRVAATKPELIQALDEAIKEFPGKDEVLLESLAQKATRYISARPLTLEHLINVYLSNVERVHYRLPAKKVRLEKRG